MKISRKHVMVLLPLVILAAILLASFMNQQTTSIDEKDYVSVYYTGYFENETVFDTNEGMEIPYTFQVGTGQVIPGFDSAVMGMKLGEEKTVTIPPEEAYGSVEGHPLQEHTLIFRIRVVALLFLVIIFFFILLSIFRSISIALLAVINLSTSA